MKVAALDLGSNTFLLLIVKIEAGRIVEVLRDEVRITRLGQGVDKNKCFHPEALERAEACFKEYSKIISQSGVDSTVAMSTSAARDATNKEEFFELGRKYQIPIEIISGDREAELTYKGTVFDLGTVPQAAVIDIGGGSTEIIGEVGGKISGFSFDVGSVRLTERFISSHPVAQEEIETMKSFVKEEFEKKKHLLPKMISPFVAVAGTPSTLACLLEGCSFDEHRVHKKVITRSQVVEWREKLGAMSLEERHEVPGLEKKRADVIVAGITILETFLECLGLDEFVVSTKGVRYGVALKS